MGTWSFFHWLVFAAIIYLIYVVFRGRSSTGEMVCKSCGFVGAAKSAVRGSLGIEIILWLCLIVPGLIYSIWRGSSRYNACPACGGKDMIPTNSPIGRKLIAETASDRAVHVVTCGRCAQTHSADAAACPHCGFARAPTASR